MQEGHIQVDVTTTRFGAYDEGLFHCREAINCHDHVVSSGRVPAFNLLALLHIAHGHFSEVSLAVEQGLENFNLRRMAFLWLWETFPILMSETELALGELETERGVESAGRGDCKQVSNWVK